MGKITDINECVNENMRMSPASDSLRFPIANVNRKIPNSGLTMHHKERSLRYLMLPLDLASIEIRAPSFGGEIVQQRLDLDHRWDVAKDDASG